MNKQNTKVQLVLDIFTHTVLYVALTAISVLFILAFFRRPSANEAYVGDFSSHKFNDGWIVSAMGETAQISLPFSVHNAKNENIILKNTVPDYVDNGMAITFRGSMEEVYVYVDEELRSSYTTVRGNGSKQYYILSAYVFADLSKEDAGKEISVRIVPQSNGVLNEVSVGYASNSWFQIIQSNFVLFMSAVIITIFGLAAVVAYFFIHRYLKNIKQLLYIALLMVDTGLWIISESNIRQLLMKSPFYTQPISIWTISLVGILAGIYFDHVQNKKHHACFVIIDSLMAAQMVVNTALHYLGIVDMHDTLHFSHFWMAGGLIMCFITIVIDFIKGTIKDYKISSIGMGLFVILALCEIVKYYKIPGSSFGVFVAAGMMVVLLTTILQTVVDEISLFTSKEDKIKQASLTTIETIMSSVDAKDEYTGGHSERVSEYVEVLARAVADRYDFTEDDIVRFKYIGLLHDIGKIGIPDRILNKAGKLTDDEYTLMKRHTIIGDDLLSSLEDIDGLSDGIRHHHERYDGKGYPDSIKGEELSIVARMLCLADCYDAMTSNRVYRKRITDEEVIEEIKRCSGTQFDPYLAGKFCELIERGMLKQSTKDGLAVNKEGEIPDSALLENLLNEDLASKNAFVTNPSFVRMVCYLIKNSEKNNEKVDVNFIYVSYKDKEKLTKDEKEELTNVLTSSYSRKMEGQDIAIKYKDGCMLLVFFNRTDKEIGDCMDRIVAEIDYKYSHEIVSLKTIAAVMNKK